MQDHKLAKWVLLMIGAVAAFVVGLILNYMFAAYVLLRVYDIGNPMAGIGKHMSPVATALVLQTGGWGSKEGVLREFKKEVHLPLDAEPGCASEHLIDFKYVTRLNPYPQPLAVIHGHCWEEPNFLSYGYIGTDQRYHQITHYWGESDTTPSFLVRKVRGLETDWGDYFVRYTVHLSKDLKPRPLIIDSRTGDVHEYQQPSKRPTIDRIDWSSYAGGSYNGFEEIGFAFFATLIEYILVDSGLALWRRHKKFPTNNEQQTSSI